MANADIADKGGRGVGEMLTMADKGGRGGLDPPFVAYIISEQPLIKLIIMKITTKLKMRGSSNIITM